MKLPGFIVGGIIIIIILMGIWLAELTGKFSIFQFLIANFWLFIIALVAIGLLSVIGAAFIGMFITHRIFFSHEFTPFEQEMLKMRQELREIKEKLTELDSKLKK